MAFFIVKISSDSLEYSESIISQLGGLIMTVLKDNATIKENYRNISDGIKLMEQIKDESISACFFDPQYRGVLDKLNYGNEGKQRGKGRASLDQMSEELIKEFIRETNRVLVPSGHLFLWVDKFHLCQGVLNWFKGTDLNLVDMITWDKGKIGMGYRTRRKSEYLIVFQKSPVRAKGCWADHSIPDVWLEKLTNKEHPHTKPYELQKRLILATTKKDDYILDPCSGSYSVFEACKETKRNFVGGDIKFGDKN